MRMTIQNTSQITTINGVPARIWEGESEGGVKVTCFITRVAVNEKDDTAQFEAELKEFEPPKPVNSWPLSMII